MKNKENKEFAETYLLRIRNKIEEIHGLENEIDALEYAASGAGGIDYSKEKVQTSSDGGRLEIFIDDIIKKKDQLEEAKASVETLKADTYSIIRQMDNSDQRIFLEWYYINAVSVDDIRKKLHVAERTIYYIRDDALEAFGAKL